MVEPLAPGSATGTFLGPACCPPPCLLPLAYHPRIFTHSAWSCCRFSLSSIHSFTPTHTPTHQSSHLPLILFPILSYSASFPRASPLPPAFISVFPFPRFVPSLPACCKLLRSFPFGPFGRPNYVSFSASRLSLMSFESLFDLFLLLLYILPFIFPASFISLSLYSTYYLYFLNSFISLFLLFFVSTHYYFRMSLVPSLFQDSRYLLLLLFSSPVSPECLKISRYRSSDVSFSSRVTGTCSSARVLLDLF